jgi:hypothetical protein
MPPGPCQFTAPSPASDAKGPPTLYSNDFRNAAAVAIRATNVYRTRTAAGSVVTCPKAGCVGQQQVIASALNAPYFVAVDATNVYWSDSGGNVALAKK